MPFLANPREDSTLNHGEAVRAGERESVREKESPAGRESGSAREGEKLENHLVLS